MLWAGLGGRVPRSSEGSTLAGLLGPDVASRHQGYTVAALTRCRLAADRKHWPTGCWLCVPQTLGGPGLTSTFQNLCSREAAGQAPMC